MVKYTRPRGTQDVLAGESPKWEYVEEKMRAAARCFGYGDLRLPTFENTELFSRGVGEGTDIVSKEMYTFADRGGRSVTLRPEGTAGIVRAVLENGLLASDPLPLKNYYLQSCFRYEKAQKGRLREFHQFGVECFGTQEPASDVEVMQVAWALFTAFGIEKAITLEINSIGCPACRPRYNQELKAYFEQRKDKLCDTCLERLNKNPLRILDCKEPACAAIAKDAPVMLEYLCEDCAAHFEQVKALLEEAGIPYLVNPRIVRGLDYYTNTVFEFMAAGVGTQGTVCAGGRYNGLIQELGGPPTPAVGFGMGIERFLLLLQEQGRLPEAARVPLLYAVGAGAAGRRAARRLVWRLRRLGLPAECDLMDRSVKAQMKAAGRLGAQMTAVLGEDEVAAGKLTLKRMADGETLPLQLDAADAELIRTLLEFGGGSQEAERL